MDEELARRCLDLQQSGDWRRFFRIIFDVLETSPKDEDASRLVFAALLAAEKIPREIIDDHRLDSFFCHCDQCGSVWVPTSVALAKVMGDNYGGHSTINPIGIECRSCGKIFCRNCYQKRGIIVMCPVCNSTSVESPMKPNGRRIQMRKSTRPTKKRWKFWKS